MPLAPGNEPSDARWDRVVEPGTLGGIELVATSTVARSAPWAHILSRVGLVIAGIMSTFNVINGTGSLIDPTFGQVDPTLTPQPVAISIALVVFGGLTLAALIPAWRGHRGALWTVVVTRLGEAWSALALPFLPGAPDGILVFAVALVVAGTLVAGLVALGLRRAA